VVYNNFAETNSGQKRKRWRGEFAETEHHSRNTNKR
jgi:hypothetical protein